MQPPGASLNKTGWSCKGHAQPEATVPQSVAGAPLAGSVPPAPAERASAAQASWATFARCRKGRYADKGPAGKTGRRGRKARQGVLGSAVNGHWKKRVVTD
ncbi:complete genome; segment 4/17 [Photorhabdus asymbiotica]|uniref:Complete genome segment 4/17 n=1 Tax=Photorhabdus asymbiotica subsp. asymbiotica (strain ATCC 43949 / 3105-77) TaxID=553480 RepID=C7BIM3_PHOAA|nr:complete genome; segment 4/17 [Photorhabdus asymbiotica]